MGKKKATSKRQASEAAKAMSSLGASKGGLARAARLSPAERQKIAREAVQARWAKTGKLFKPPEPEAGELPLSLFRGALKIGELEVECHVLNDLRRVLTQREVIRVITAGRESGNIQRYLDANPLIDRRFVLGETIQFRQPGTQYVANGFEGTLLVDLCTKYLEAADLGLLKKNQLHLARQSEIVVRACAKVGIVALIDEATGYQKVRARQALQIKLQAFIADDMQEWAKMFPDEFWFELARLENVKYSPRNRPLRWGRYVMIFVYDAIDSDVGRELRRKNPDPHFLNNHHQWLKKYGRQKVNDQIQRVIAVMNLCQDMDEFRAKFAHVFKKAPLQLTFADLDWAS